MSEPVYKRITDLPTATLPLATGDLLEVSQSGTSGKATFGGIFGAGWFTKLAAAFTVFVAPEATHAVNADTLGPGAETPADLHDAAQLTGAIHLDRIPAELTGKNAATADLADVATLAHACDGNAATADSAGSINIPYIMSGGSLPLASSQYSGKIYVEYSNLSIWICINSQFGSNAWSWKQIG